jgi:hypothetical protein
MPLSAVTPVLAQGFLKLFQDPPPPSGAAAADTWATAYSEYCLAGGATVLPPKKDALAKALEAAFSPLASAGPSGLVAALALFWPGTPVPGMAPTAIAVAFTPTGDQSLVIPGIAGAPPQAQAQGLAQIIHALTIASVKVVIPPSPTPVPIV